MLIGLAAGLGAATVWGVSAALQARAFRALPTSPWTAVVLEALRSPAVLTVVLMDCGGFVLDYIAIQTLPLYLSQACIATAVIVTALTAATILDEKPPRTQWYGLATLAVGLVLLALSAGDVGRQSMGWPLVIGCYVGIGVLVVLGTSAFLLPGTRGAATLGLLAGAAYGIVPIAARALEAPYISWLNLADVGVLAGGGVLGFAFYSFAAPKAAVNIATAPLTMTETIVPSIVGVMLFNDGIRNGWTPVMVLGLVLSVAGAAAVPLLARAGTAERVDA